MIGWIFAIFAENIWMIYLSRLFVGASHAMLTTSIYAIEITSKEMRASCSFFEGVPRCVGSLMVYLAGMFFRWQQIAYVSWIIPLMALLLTKFCPETPMYLVNNGKDEKAFKVLYVLNANNENSTQG